jgi:UDP-2,3-diacylglucosamine pyrophosphatase LpxH
MYKNIISNLNIPYGDSVLELNEDSPCLVVSDLHIGSGKNESGNFKSHENFLYDKDFSDFIDHYLKNGKHHLIVNGDFIDFVRIVDIPKTEEDYKEWLFELSKLGLNFDLVSLKNSISKKEKKFGLKTHRFKSIYKLMMAINGHLDLFTSLSKAFLNGWNFTWTKGNHDLEIIWPEIREYFLIRLAEIAHIIDNSSTIESKIEQFSKQINFIDHQLIINDNIVIEHGHRFDKISTVNGPDLLENQEEINYPIGTFFNRYLMNKIESSYPYIDNIRPIESVFSKVFKDDMIEGLKLLFYHIPLAFRLLGKGNVTYFLKPLIRSLLVFIIPMAFLSYALFFNLSIISDKLDSYQISIVYKAAILIIWSILSFVIMKILSHYDLEVPSYYSKEAEKLLKNDPKIKLYTVGHSHNPQQLKLGDQVFYNTGTWIPLLEWNSSDIRLNIMFSFVYIKINADKSIQSSFLRWNRERRDIDDIILIENRKLREA